MISISIVVLAFFIACAGNLSIQASKNQNSCKQIDSFGKIEHSRTLDNQDCGHDKISSLELMFGYIGYLIIFGIGFYSCYRGEKDGIDMYPG